MTPLSRLLLAVVLLGATWMMARDAQAECAPPSLDATVELLRSAVFEKEGPMSEDGARLLVKRSDAEARRRGFVRADDLLGYTFVTRIWGNDFGASRPWAAEILSSQMPAHTKIQKLLYSAGRDDLSSILNCGVIRPVRFGETFEFRVGDIAIAPDGLIVTARSAAMAKDHVNVQSIDLTLSARHREETIQAFASEHRRGMDYLFIVSEPSPVLKLRIETNGHRFTYSGGDFGKPTWLRVGDIVGFPGEYVVDVERITFGPRSVVVKDHKETGDVTPGGDVLQLGLRQPVQSRDYVVEALEFRGTSADSAAVLLVVRESTHR